MFRYSVVPGAHIQSKDAVPIAREIERLQKATKVVTWAHILDAARSPRSVMHKYFTWDVVKAAHERWEEQAHYILRSVKVQEDDKPPVRLTVYFRFEENPGYMIRTKVLKDRELSAFDVQQALMELRSWAVRYARIVQFYGLKKHVDAIVADVESALKKRKKIG
jgi:hypothetical protein